MEFGIGGKQGAIYFFPAGGEFDGMAIAELPDDVTAEGLKLFIRATGNSAESRFVISLTAARLNSGWPCSSANVYSWASFKEQWCLDRPGNLNDDRAEQEQSIGLPQ